MKLTEHSSEVFFCSDTAPKASFKDIEFLKKKADSNKYKRARVCLHKNTDDKLHEMMIVHTKNTYVRPHKHLNKSESLYVIEGSADAVMYDDGGKILDVLRLGDYRSGQNFFYRISSPVYHNLFINTKFFVFHEVTNGPFNRADTVFAPWAPPADNAKAYVLYMKSLAKKMDSLISHE